MDQINLILNKNKKQIELLIFKELQLRKPPNVFFFKSELAVPLENLI